MSYPVRFVGGALDGKYGVTSGEQVVAAITPWGAYALDTRVTDAHDGYLVFRVVQ